MVDLSFMSNKKHKHPKNPEHELEVAHKKAEKIIEHAVHKAETIESEFMHLKDRLDNEILHFSQQADQKYMEIIDTQSKNFEMAYRDIMNEVQKKYLEGAEVHVKAMNDAVTQEVNQISPALKGFLTQMREEFSKHFQKELEMMTQEIAAYKTEQKNQIQEELKKEVSEKTQLILETVIRKSLSQEEHEKLILEAIDEATNKAKNESKVLL